MCEGKVLYIICIAMKLLFAQEQRSYQTGIAYYFQYRFPEPRDFSLLR